MHPSHSIVRGWLVVAVVIVCTLTGCRNRAYTELYVDNMAAEIRAMEDLVNSYEHEYRALENQHASLKRENERLRQAIQGSQHSRIESGSSGGPSGVLEFRPRQPLEESQATDTLRIPKEPSTEKAAESASPNTPPRASILDSNPPEKSVPSKSQQDNSQSPQNGRSAPLDLPKVEMPDLPSNIPPVTDGILPPPNQPDPKGSTTDSASPRRKLDGEPVLLAPPTIELGEPSPPRHPLQVSQNPGAKRGAPNQLEINLGRIEIPGQLSSHVQTGVQSGLPRSQKSSDVITDRRIVEIGFHPTLCRGNNSDSSPGDDGLYLVLQPRNERGQVIPQAGDLSIAAIDPTRNGNSVQVGNWHFSASQLQEKIQPIGSSQGIHLSLPWNGTGPNSERVEVVVLLTLDGGKRLQNEKTIYVSRSGNDRAVWVPRGNADSVNRTASHTEPLDDSGRRVAGSTVVRPATAIMPRNPAPRP